MTDKLTLLTHETEWLISWFGQRGPLPAGDEELPALNYFTAGLIDSLGVIELICAVEAHFGIRFGEGHFQERRFSTIAGLAAIITEVRASTSCN